MPDDSVGKKTERRGLKGGRRQWDKEMEQKVEIIGLNLQRHLDECAKNYNALKESVDRTVAWIEPKIEQEKARAAVWLKVQETVLTDTMAWLLKVVVLVSVVAIASAIIPAGRGIIEHLIKSGP